MKELIALVTQWYHKEKRDIVWRNDATPYHIWLSEIMCQQTRIETVISYYLRFIEAVPDIKSLSQVSDDKLNKLWQGLGYYSRARNLKKAAIQIMEQYNGVFPDQYDEVINLCGIGEYTAGAILSIAYGKNYSAVDGNVLRVLSRVQMDNSDIADSATKKKCKQLIEEHLEEDPGSFNQGMMDIGATICLPNGAPKCDICPLKEKCKAHHGHVEMQYPFKSRTIRKKEEDYTVFIIRNNNQLVLHKRSHKGLLADLYELKNVAGHLDYTQVQQLFPGAVVLKGQDKDFVFTHKLWHMISYIIETNNYQLEEGEIFVSQSDLDQKYSVPTAFRQFVE